MLRDLPIPLLKHRARLLTRRESLSTCWPIGPHLYYPSRWQMRPVLAAFIETVRGSLR